ncbi:peptidyl-prolyl cis-trans isomerase [bacterium]|nr:peptidyl-prolyl cis-trans isomerase [bacterium]
MLKTLRTKTRRVMLATLILVIPSFVFYFGWNAISQRDKQQPTEFARFRPPKPGGEGQGGWIVLLAPDLRQTRREMQQQLTSTFGPEATRSILQEVDADEIFPIRDTIREAINQRILAYYADSKDINVTRNDLRSAIQQDLGPVPKDQIPYVLNQSGFNSSQEYESYVYQATRVGRAAQDFTNQAKVSHYELWDLYQLQKAQLKMDYTIFNVSDFEDLVPTTDALLEQYYQANQEKFRVGRQRQYAYAYLKKDDLASGLELSDSALRQYYESHPEQFVHDRQVKVRQVFLPIQQIVEQLGREEYDARTSETLRHLSLVREEMAAGTDFSEVADRISQDPSNTSATLSGEGAKLGGLVPGWISRDRASEFGLDFVEKALELAENEISEPVQAWVGGANGYSILQVVDSRPAGTSDFEEVRDRAKRLARRGAVDDAFSERMNEIANEVPNYSNVSTLAQDMGMQDGMTSWVLTTSPVLSKDLFIRNDDLDYITTEFEKGEMTPLLNTEDTMYVVSVKDEKPSYVPEDFREVRDRVEAAYRVDKALEMAEAATKGFLEITAGDDSSTGTLLSEDFLTTDPVIQGRTMTTTGLFSRTELPQALRGRLIDFIQDTYIVRSGDTGITEVGSGAGNANGYLVWRMRDVVNPERAKFEEDLPALELNYLILAQQALLNEWLWDQRQQSQIRINEDYLPTAAEEEAEEAAL